MLRMDGPPPVGPFRAPRVVHLPRWLRDAGMRQPRPLRDTNHPAGLLTLTADEQERVTKGNILATFAAAVADWCLERKIPFVVENPGRSWMWQLPCFKELEGNPSVMAVCFHACKHGSRRDKLTKLLTNYLALEPLAKMCDNSHHHDDWSMQFKQRWEFATASEAEYPAQLCS